MREIKFRAWGGKNMDYFDLPDLAKHSEGDWWYDNDPVMQYTGLKDKNGKEIYEGDVVSISKRRVSDGAARMPRPGQYGEVKIGVVRYNNDLAAFRVKTDNYHIDNGISDSMKFSQSWVQDLEVIGNIYENPELLNERKGS